MRQDALPFCLVNIFQVNGRLEIETSEGQRLSKGSIIVVKSTNFGIRQTQASIHTQHSVCVCVCVCQLLSHVQLFATPWTIACQASLSMEFSRQEYWSGLPFPQALYMCVYIQMCIYIYIYIYTHTHIGYINFPKLLFPHMITVI